MPYREMPWIRDGRLFIGADEEIVVDSAAWFAWLRRITSFCYSSQHSWVRLTVRQEKRGTNFYWYGYSKINSKLHNVYLGKLEHLTHARLEEACQHIYQRSRKGGYQTQSNMASAPNTTVR